MKQAPHRETASASDSLERPLPSFSRSAALSAGGCVDARTPAMHCSIPGGHPVSTRSKVDTSPTKARELALDVRPPRPSMPLFGSKKRVDSGDGQHEVLLATVAGVKVRAAALHASRPWAAAGDDLGFVSIHDFQTLQEVFRMQLDPRGEGDGRSGVKAAPVRLVAFLDASDAGWRARLECEASGGIMLDAAGSAAPMPPVRPAAAAEQQLAAVSDRAVFLIDYARGHVREVSALDARAVNALSAVPAHEADPLLLAAACADGVVRLLDAAALRVAVELSCGKKKGPALTHLAVFCRRAAVSAGGAGGLGGRGLAKIGIVASGSDGYVYLWHPGASAQPVSVVAAGAEVSARDR